MKIPIYLKIADKGRTTKGTKYKMEANPKPDHEPIMDKSYHPISVYPTVFLGFELTLPDDIFDYASKIIAEIDYRKSDIKVEMEIPKELKIGIKKSALDNLKQ